MSFLRSPQPKHRITIETPVPALCLDAFHLQDAVAEVHYEIVGGDDPFEGVPVNDRRTLAKLMTDYVQFKLPPYKRKQLRHSNAAMQYFLRTDREN